MCAAGLQGTTPLTFTWDCVRQDFPKPCFTGTNMGSIKGSMWGLWFLFKGT
jgi:hypothetical protein